jgi:hypothetical protein
VRGGRHAPQCPDFTLDYELIETGIPADDDTIDTEPPKFAVARDAKAPPR